MNPFLQIHTSADGESEPIVSMDANHLVNMVNLLLRKVPKQIVEERRSQEMRGYTTEEVNPKAKAFLNLKFLGVDELREIEQELETFHVEIINASFEKAWPYILVGLVRDDTREGVLKIVQEVTGVTTRVIISVPQKVTESKQLPSRIIWNDDNDEPGWWTPGHPDDYGDK